MCKRTTTILAVNIHYNLGGYLNMLGKHFIVTFHPATLKKKIFIFSLVSLFRSLSVCMYFETPSYNYLQTVK